MVIAVWFEFWKPFLRDGRYRCESWIDGERKAYPHLVWGLPNASGSPDGYDHWDIDYPLPF